MQWSFLIFDQNIVCLINDPLLDILFKPQPITNTVSGYVFLNHSLAQGLFAVWIW